MVDFFASRPMEDFFINPTIDDCQRKPALQRIPTVTKTNIMDSPAQYRAALRDYHHERRSSSTKDAALNQYAVPPRITMPESTSPSWQQRYDSEEEGPSPVSYHSSSSNTPLDGPVSPLDDEYSLEQAAVISTAVVQQCNKAQIVRIQSIGRAKVVSLPKLVTTAPVRRPTTQASRPVTENFSRPKTMRLESISESRSRNSHDSSSSSNGSTSPVSPISTAPSSLDEFWEQPSQQRHQKTASKHIPLMQAAASSKHIPLMEAARAITPLSPEFPSSATSLRRGSLPDPRSPMTPKLRRTSKFGLNRAFTIAKSSNHKEDVPSLSTIMEPPARRSTMVGRLVARGANEREPSLRLPPCPQ